MADLLGGLLAPYRAAADATPTGIADSPLLMLAIQSIMGGGTSSPGGANQRASSPAGGPSGPVQHGTAQQLAEQAARMAGVPIAWARDPKFWYQTEHESGLYPNEGWSEIVKAAHANNPTSSAYGIGQFLDATRATYNLPLHASPLAQLEAMFRYIRDRYHNPAGAYAHRMATGWY